MKTKHTKYAYGLVAAMLMTGSMPALGFDFLLWKAISAASGHGHEKVVFSDRKNKNGQHEIADAGHMFGETSDKDAREMSVIIKLLDTLEEKGEKESVRRILTAVAQQEQQFELLAMREAEQKKAALDKMWMDKKFRHAVHTHLRHYIGHHMNPHMKGFGTSEKLYKGKVGVRSWDSIKKEAIIGSADKRGRKGYDYYNRQANERRSIEKFENKSKGPHRDTWANAEFHKKYHGGLERHYIPVINDADENMEEEKENRPEFISESKWRNNKMSIDYEDDEYFDSESGKKAHKMQGLDEPSLRIKYNDELHQKTQKQGMHQSAAGKERTYRPGKPVYGNISFRESLKESGKKSLNSIHPHSKSFDDSKPLVNKQKTQDFHFKGQGELKGGSHRFDKKGDFASSKHMQVQIDHQRKRMVFHSGEIKMFHARPKDVMPQKWAQQHGVQRYSGAEVWNQPTHRIQLQSQWVVNMHAQHGKFCERGREMGARSAIRQHEFTKHMGDKVSENLVKIMQFKPVH